MLQIAFTVLCQFRSLWSVCHCHSHLHCLYNSHNFSHSELCHNLVYNVIILTDSAEVGCFANLWTWTKWWLVKTSRQYTPPYQGTAAGTGELTRRILWHGQDTEQVQYKQTLLTEVQQLKSLPIAFWTSMQILRTSAVTTRMKSTLGC